MVETINRESQRILLSKDIAKVSKAELFKYGITRVGCVGYLDRIGLPIFTSMRPGAYTISINSGKSTDRDMARAGSILEAMEIWSSETPFGKYIVCPENHLSDKHLPFSQWPTVRGSIVTPDHPISWEICYSLDGSEIYIPSDMVYMVQRTPTPFLNFQSSSNGLASGVTFIDACLSALYEVVERDAWTLSDVARDQCQIWPMRVSLEDLSQELELLVNAILRADLVPILYDITSDLRIPCFSCIIFDPNADSAGSFAGHGCHLNAEHAMKRSIMEAIQSRAVYISGARDDLFRRSFMVNRGTNQEKMIKQSLGLPIQGTMWDYRPLRFESVRAEWDHLIQSLISSGIDKIYTKELYHNESEFECSLVRVLAPQLEAPRFDHWKPGRRSVEYLRSLSVTQG